MTEGKQGGPIEPPENEMLPGYIQQAPGETPNTETGSALSAVGLVCQSILATINGSHALSDDERTAIANSVNAIISLSREETARTEALKQKLAAQKAKLQRANEHLALLRQEIFGPSSEQACSDSELDDELAELADLEDLEDEAPKAKGKRAKKIPPGAETRVIHHYPENRTCATCNHEMKSIGSWVGKRYVVIPEQVLIENHHYHTCACNRGLCKENKPVAAKAQGKIMKGQTMGIGFVLEAAVQKFLEHTPIYRMERRLKYSNLTLSRQTIGRQIAALSTHFSPVREALFEHVKQAYMAHMDETPIRVQAPGKGKCATGQIWAVGRDETAWNKDAKPAVAFFYSQSRSGTVAEGLLADSALKYLMTDGYAGYNKLFAAVDGANDHVASARCWAHARRKFHEVKVATKSKLASRVFGLIRDMYMVERAAKGLAPEEREALRQKESLPRLNEIHRELTMHLPSAEGKLKDAISYTLKAFDSLRCFIFDGRIEIDNNFIERTIRGIALTKKNSLFAGNDDAGEVWAIYFSLIQSARLNKIDPRRYLSWVVQEIERQWDEDIDYSQLMPWNCPVGRFDT